MKKTKIVATISDMNCSVEFIQKLYQNGMNVVRLNSAHQSLEGALKIIHIVRSVSDRIAIMMDTKGPEIRTGIFKKPYKVEAGQTIALSGNSKKSNCIPVTFPEFVREVPIGSSVLIDDGDIELLAIEVSADGDSLICKVINGGTIKSKKGINIPNVFIDLPSISEKDKLYINFSIENNLDFIAHSFVRNRKDVESVQKILDEHKSNIKIIAKIENQKGVNNIDEILDAAYGVMVARGDLAIEIPYAKVPGIQKMLINKCIERRKPVIVATQMLHSMIEEPRPTRAEVNDVASAIYNQADAVMLSGETAIGKFPVEAVTVMASIAQEVEKDKDDFYDIPIVVINNKISSFLIKAAVEAASELNAKAIIADTTSGRTIRSLVAYRGNRPILVQSYCKETVRHLALSYGVSARFMTPKQNSHEFIGETLEQLQKENILQINDMIVVIAGNFGRSKGASFVEIGSVENLLKPEERS